MKIQNLKQVTVTEAEQVIIESIRVFTKATKAIASMQCSACKQRIGNRQPAAVAFGNGRGWRLCSACIPTEVQHG